MRMPLQTLASTSQNEFLPLTLPFVAASPPLEAYVHDTLFHRIPLTTPGLKCVSAEPYIFTVDGFLSDDEADALVAKASRAEEPSSSKLERRGERTSRTVVPQHQEVAGLRGRLSALVGVSLAQMQPLKITRYDSGGLFMRHTDCTEALRDANGDDASVLQQPNRFCTVLIYLDDVPHGGRTCWRWRDEDPLFYARQRAQCQGTSPLVGRAMVAASDLRRKLLPLRAPLCIRPKKGMAVIHFPCTSARAGLVMDPNADHESEAAVDVKHVCQQFIWSAPMVGSDAEHVDARLRAKFRAFEEQQPNEPLSETVI